MATPGVVFLGNDPWSVPSLEAIAGARDLALVRVLTRVPRPAGRGDRLRPTAVAEASRRLGLPLVEVETVGTGTGLEAVRSAAPALLAVVAYGELLPAAVLELPTVGPVNLHFSLLPALRGASPVQHALLQGLRRTGVTTILMDAGMDTGPILRRQEEEVRADDDAGSLGERLARIGASVLVGTLRDLAAGRIEPTPQPSTGASVAPKLAPGDRRLRWDEPAEALERRIRALAPEPAAAARFRGRVLKVYRAEVVEAVEAIEAIEAAAGAEAGGTPGDVLALDEGIVVAAGRGALRLLDVGPEGRRRMTAAEFARGHRPTPGERLG